ncbi:MAG: ribosome small subunit-dependent GTPase A [Clostridia bacterium]|nr:ribosome small subunit-dependent GTPase A [Clostridia bacterium]
MSNNIEGIILSGLGGLYSVKAESGEVYPCRAKGAFRKAKLTPLVGDRVSIRPPEVAGEEYFIEKIYPRQNALIRPPMANLETLFVTFAPKNPEPSTLYLDKLLSIAVYNHITPVVVITKQDISPSLAEKYADIYRKTGHRVFLCSSEDGAGIDALAEYVHSLKGICAFAGASGVGKSTLLNALFPKLSLDTGKLSEKIARGKHTTRSVTLYPMKELIDIKTDAFVADTPGFSMLDFIEFDFYTLEDLPHCFPEFEPYMADCRYTDCSHTKESAKDCAVVAAIERGEIAKERHESYLSIYADLVQKKPWEKK